MRHKLEVDSIILEFGDHRVLQDVYFANETGMITDHLHRYITEISDQLYVITNGKAHLTNTIEDLKTFGYIH